MKRTKRPLPALGIALLLVLSLAGLAGAEPSGEQTAKQETKVKSSFSDVEAGNKNLLFINYLAEREIISGFPDGSYHPGEGLSRAEAAVVMVKAAGLNPETGKETGFPDVNADYWAASYITVAAEAGYLKGFPDGSYHPDEKLTRVQGIALVMRLCTQKQAGDLPQLKDMNAGHWAAGPMAMAIAAGMIEVSAEGQVYPENVLERGSLARALGILLTRDPGLYARSLTGTVKEVKGEITLTRQGEERKLTDGSPVYAGDLIKAGPKSSASILYPDGSSVLVEENTEISIKQSEGRAYIKKNGDSGIAVDNLNIELTRGTVFGALASKQETKENQVAGAAYPLLASLNGAGLLAAQEAPPWYQTADQKKVKMQVDMPWGVAAVRGTFIMVTVNNDGSINLSCLSGDVDLSNKDQNGQIQGATNVGAGSSGGVTGQGGLNPVEGMSEADRQAFEQVQVWVLESALQMDVNQEVALEMIVETPGLQVQSTLNVIVEALQNSGIEINPEVIESLKEQLEELQQEVPDFDQTAGQSQTPGQTNESSTESDTSSVSYMRYNSAGTYGSSSAENPQNIAKSVIVSAPGITLQNMIISRDLTLAAGIGEGDVTLINVRVGGNTNILGGGASSVELIDCELYTVSVDKENNSVRIVTQGSTSIGTVTLNSGAVLEEGDDLEGDGFGNVLAGLSITEGATITLSGNFASVNIEAPGLIIEVESGTIGELTIASSAGRTSLTLAQGTSVDTLQLNAAAVVGGEGSINTANINASGVTIEQIPANLYVSSGVEANVGGQPVSGGTTRIVSTIEITGAQSISVPATGTTRTYSAKVYDQQGNEMTGESVTWSLLPTGLVGVSIGASTGELSVSSSVNATSCTIVATSVSNSSKSGQFPVALSPFVPVAASIEQISGPANVSIAPGDEGSITAEYSAVVLDQNDEQMTGESVTWSLLPTGLVGVSIGASTGELSVSSSVNVTSCTIVATSVSDTSVSSEPFLVKLLPPWEYVGGEPGISGALLPDSDIGMVASSEGQVGAAWTESDGSVMMGLYYEEEGSWDIDEAAEGSSGKGPLDLQTANVVMEDEIVFEMEYPLLAWGEFNAQNPEEDAVVIQGVEGSLSYNTGETIESLSVGLYSFTPTVAYINSYGSVKAKTAYGESLANLGDPSADGNISSAREVETAFGINWVDETPYAYLAYRDGEDGSGKGSIGVMQGIYDYGSGFEWGPLGSERTGSDLSLNVSNGVPYLAYSDEEGCARVERWDTDETEWVDMGGTASPGAASDLSLCVVPNGIPYLAFSDATREGRASVVKLVYDSEEFSCDWAPLGAGLSPGAAAGLKLDVSDDMLYLAFKEKFEDEEGTTADKVTVMSYSDPLAGVDFNFLFLPIGEFSPGEWSLDGLGDGETDPVIEFSLDGGNSYQQRAWELRGNINDPIITDPEDDLYNPFISPDQDILVRLASQREQVLHIDLLSGPPIPEASINLENEYYFCGLEPGCYYEIDITSDQGTDIVCPADANGKINFDNYNIPINGGYNCFNIRQASTGKTFHSDWQVIEIYLAC